MPLDPTPAGPGPLDQLAQAVLAAHDQIPEAAAQELVRRLLVTDQESDGAGFQSRDVAVGVCALLELPDTLAWRVHAYADGFAHGLRTVTTR